MQNVKGSGKGVGIEKEKNQEKRSAWKSVGNKRIFLPSILKSSVSP